MSLPSELSAAEFLRRFFKHLTIADLKNCPDKTLHGLLDYYIAANRREIPQENKEMPKQYEPVANPLSLFDVYLAYLNREEQATDDQRAAEFMKILDDIKRVDLEIKADLILQKRKLATDFNKELETLPYYVKCLQEEEHKISNSRSAKTSKSSTILMSKRLGLRVIGEAIRLSYVKKEEDEKTTIESQHKTHQEQADIVLQETQADLQAAGLHMPKPIEDKRFRKRNDLLLSYTTTTNRIKRLLTMDTTSATVLKQAYVFDASPLIQQQFRALCHPHEFKLGIISTATTLQTVEIKETCGNKVITHMQARATPQLNPWRVTNMNQSAGRITVIDRAPLVYLYEQRNRPVVYVMGCNELNVGGMADQGFDSKIEAPIYHATTYSAALETCIPAYPIPAAHVIYIPYVLFVKAPSEPYEMLPGSDSGRIRVMCSASLYRPAVLTKLTSQDTQVILQDRATRFANPEKFKVNFLAGLLAAAALGCREIVVDDRGVDDYLLPMYHTAELIIECLQAVRSGFDSIALCTTRKDFAQILREHL